MMIHVELYNFIHPRHIKKKVKNMTSSAQMLSEIELINETLREEYSEFKAWIRYKIKLIFIAACITLPLYLFGISEPNSSIGIVLIIIWGFCKAIHYFFFIFAGILLLIIATNYIIYRIINKLNTSLIEKIKQNAMKGKFEV
jgi:hypothetical protein